MLFIFLVISYHFKCHVREVTGQNDRQMETFSRQIIILTGHCPLTSHYFEPCAFADDLTSVFVSGVLFCVIVVIVTVL